MDQDPRDSWVRRRRRERLGRGRGDEHPGRWIDRAFRSLRVRNLRLFFAGQLISGIGIFMDHTARVWLVLKLTGDGTAVGIATGLAFAPLLLLGPWAGLVADRLDRLRLVKVAQTVLTIGAVILGVLVVVDQIELWMVYVLAFLSGIATAFDNTARRSLLADLVAHDDVANAASLQNSLGSVSRTLGLAAGGFLVAAVGIAPSFFANALSYVVSIACLAAMDPARIASSERVARRRGQLREGFRYAATTRAVRVPLVLTAVVCTISFNYLVTVPLLANRAFGSGPATVGMLMSVLGIGSIIGALYVAGSRHINLRYLSATVLGFGAVTLAASASPTLLSFAALLFLTGATGMAFAAVVNGLLQRDTEPAMRGRIMALYSVAFVGSATIGSPVVGLVADHVGARAGFAIGGLTALLAGAWTLRTTSHRREHLQSS